jgi:hypothetical protein
VTQYIAMMWTEKKGKLLQVFGPYPSEYAAQSACDRISQWPMAKNGVWEVTELYPNPPQDHAVGSTVTLYPTYTQWNWPVVYPTTVTIQGAVVPRT